MKLVIGLLIISSNVFAIGDISINKKQFKKIADQLNATTNSKGKCDFTRRELNKVYMAKEYANYKDFKNLVAPAGTDMSSHWDCIFLKRSIKRDQDQCNVMPSMVFDNLKEMEDKTVEVEGKTSYVGLVPKKYKYKIELINGVATAIVNIHFKKGVYSNENYKKYLLTMDKALKDAEEKWNTQVYNNLFRFSFNRVDSEELADFSVKLKEKDTRGPYDTRWSIQFGVNTVAHEIGHMMGLDDEYDNVIHTTMTYPKYWSTFLDKDFKDTLWVRFGYAIDGTKLCDDTSIMCNPYSKKKIKKFQVYNIFKRFYCN